MVRVRGRDMVRIWVRTNEGFRVRDGIEFRVQVRMKVEVRIVRRQL
jgi:hypothetical protein